MRFLMIAGAATFLLLPAGAPANACGAASMHSAQAATVDYSAVTKKPVKKTAKMKKEKGFCPGWVGGLAKSGP